MPREFPCPVPYVSVYFANSDSPKIAVRSPSPPPEMSCAPATRRLRAKAGRQYSSTSASTNACIQATTAALHAAPPALREHPAPSIQLSPCLGLPVPAIQDG